jgi:hypothetical protein
VIGRLGPIHNEFCPVDGAPEMFSLLCFYEWVHDGSSSNLEIPWSLWSRAVVPYVHDQTCT